ncbi:hypothetical protein [Serratia ureilytica]|uniref:hypothetical protein n=1 Tax=Serratia ureilytica TaxID=300181 RepID=UPI003FA6B045
MSDDKAFQLTAPEVDSLLILCDEAMRATPENVKRFIEPAPGVLAQSKAKQHSIIFGRRGSGKSSLLRKVVADLTLDRRPISFVDMETFKGHSYPDVLISVLIKSLQEFEKWLETAATTPAQRTKFWLKFWGSKPERKPFNKAKTGELVDELKSIIKDLSERLAMPEIVDVQHNSQNESSLSGSVKAGISSPIAKVDGEVATGSKLTVGVQKTYQSHKTEYLHQNILRFQRFFTELGELSDGPAYLILDDLYHIRRSDQAKVIDYFHRIAKGNSLWLKIGTIKHRSDWYIHTDPPIGVKLGDDAKEINIDISLEKFLILKEFMRKILSNIMDETPPLNVNGLLNSTAIDRLIIASGGVTRDFIGIFAKAINQARNRGVEHHRGPKVGAEDVNLATGEYGESKREEFKLDANEDRVALEESFQKLVDFCIGKSKCNIFLIPLRKSENDYDAIEQLIDLRLVHLVQSRVTLKKGAEGKIFQAYMLDTSEYVASRKVHGFTIIDLNSKSFSEDIRKSKLVYSPLKD